MLPVLIAEPVRFNVGGHRQQQLRPTSDNGLTLYPVTVEFDRLLRRQQQLGEQQHRQSSSASSPHRRHQFLRQSSVPNGKGLKQQQQQQPSMWTGSATSTSNMFKSTSSNVAFNASSLSLASTSTGETSVESILSGYDVYELLYATIIHYYSTLQVNSIGRKGSNTLGGSTSKSNKGSGNINITSSTVGAGSGRKAKAESRGDGNMNATLQHIHHVLCTPGTRTLLMLAERSEIVARMAANYQDRNGGGGGGEKSNEEMAAGVDGEEETDATSDLGTESSSLKDGRVFHRRGLRQQDSTTTCTSEEGGGTGGGAHESEATSSQQQQQQQEPRRSESAQYFDHLSRLLGETHLNAKDNHSSCSSGGGSSSGSKSKKNKNKTTKAKDDTSRTLLQSLDCYLQQALQRKLNFHRQLRHLAGQAQQQHRPRSKDGDNGGRNAFWAAHYGTLAEYIGLEQMIVGGITYYKSYRLSGVKMIELATLGVQSRYQRNGIGSYLLKAVKENGQIGLYDVIRVNISANNFNTGQSLTRIGSMIKGLRNFFARNDFSDDLVLNASFDQLDNILSNNHDDDDDEDDFEDDDDGDEDYEDDYDDLEEGEECCTKLTAFTKSIQHSISLLDHLNTDGQHSPAEMITSPANDPQVLSHQYHEHCHNRRRRPRRRQRTLREVDDEFDDHSSSSRMFTLTMCYLPPFSVSSLGPNRSLGTNEVENRAMLSELDNRYIDEIIDEANRSWRSDLLSSYRTQWSCVSRLRAEMLHLRSRLRQKGMLVEQLRRENYQLRTTLLQNERSMQMDDNKQVMFLKTLNLDSLNF